MNLYFLSLCYKINKNDDFKNFDRILRELKNEIDDSTNGIEWTFSIDESVSFKYFNFTISIDSLLDRYIYMECINDLNNCCPTDRLDIDSYDKYLEYLEYLKKKKINLNSSS